MWLLQSHWWLFVYSKIQVAESEVKGWDVYGGPTMVDGAVVAGEEGLHQRGLLFALLGPACAGSGVHIGLHHQRFLPFLLLLLLQKSSLHGHIKHIFLNMILE